jgi:hypothetical protein
VKLAWSFGRAFVGAFIVGIAGINAVPDLSAAKALVFAAIVAAITAGIRAVEQTLLSGSAHVKNNQT